MKLVNAARGWAPVLFVFALSACGGGDDSSPPPDLSKYQGTWTEQCAYPIEFQAGSFGPGSVRSSLTFSAPDASGKVLITLTAEFFDTTLSCGDTTTAAIATIKNDVPVEGRPSRTQVGASPVAGSLLYDVIGLTIPAQNLGGVGPAISSVTGGTVPLWRVTFSDGKTDDTEKPMAAGTGELFLNLNKQNPGTPWEIPILWLPGYSQNWVKK